MGANGTVVGVIDSAPGSAAELLEPSQIDTPRIDWNRHD